MGAPKPADLHDRVREIIEGHFAQQDIHIDNLAGLYADIKAALPVPPSADQWAQIRAGVLGKIAQPAPVEREVVDYLEIIHQWKNHNRLDDDDKKARQMQRRWEVFFDWLVAERGYPEGCRDMARTSMSEDLDAYKDYLFARLNSNDPEETIKTSKAVEDRLRRITRLYHFGIKDLRNKTLIATNPILNFTVPKGETDPRNKYQDYTLDDVRLTLTKARKAPPEIRWPNWLAAYSGAREAEVVEAQTSDIEVDPNGVVIFHIRLDNRPPKQQIKTKFSARPVPLHDAVLAEGFLDYVESIRAFHGGEGPLFPQFKLWRDRLNTDASARLMKWLRDEVGIKHPKKVFHSWRHTVKTRFRETDAEGNHYMPREDIADKLTGHAKGEIGRKYGYFPNPTLHANIRRVPAWL